MVALQTMILSRTFNLISPFNMELPFPIKR
jgi:hypothetical protein